MTQPSRSYVRHFPALGALALLASVAAASCSDDDGDDAEMGAGVAGEGGSAGSAAGLGGTGGVGGSGSEPVEVPTGTIEVLSSDAMRLLGPTTVALRGDTLWFANGQLSGLFGGTTPTLPFTARSLPLEGGPLGDDEIELTGDTFYPEGIAADSDGTLYIGSVATRDIVRVPAGSLTAENFLPDTVAERGVIGLKVDEPRELLWFCDSNPTQDTAAAAVVGVSLADASEVVRHELSTDDDASLFCNDIYVDSLGNVWATESRVGIVYRIPAANALVPDSAVAWLRGGLAEPPPNGFGANGIAVVGGQLIVANSDSGSLFTVDPDSQDPAGDAELIVLEEPDREGEVTLCGPDGILAVPDSDDLIVIENGGCTPAVPRVIKVTLDVD